MQNKFPSTLVKPLILLGLSPLLTPKIEWSVLTSRAPNPSWSFFIRLKFCLNDVFWHIYKPIIEVDFHYFCVDETAWSQWWSLKKNFIILFPPPYNQICPVTGIFWKMLTFQDKGVNFRWDTLDVVNNTYTPYCDVPIRWIKIN